MKRVGSEQESSLERRQRWRSRCNAIIDVVPGVEIDPTLECNLTVIAAFQNPLQTVNATQTHPEFQTFTQIKLSFNARLVPVAGQARYTIETDGVDVSILNWELSPTLLQDYRTSFLKRMPDTSISRGFGYEDGTVPLPLNTAHVASLLSRYRLRATMSLTQGNRILIESLTVRDKTQKIDREGLVVFEMEAQEGPRSMNPSAKHDLTERIEMTVFLERMWMYNYTGRVLGDPNWSKNFVYEKPIAGNQIRDPEYGVCPGYMQLVELSFGTLHSCAVFRFETDMMRTKETRRAVLQRIVAPHKTGFIRTAGL